MKIKKLSAGVLALALSVGAVAPVVGSFVTTSYASSTNVNEIQDDIANHTTNITVHKLRRTGDETIENPRGGNLTEIPEGLERYNANQDGAVGFTLYRIGEVGDSAIFTTNTNPRGTVSGTTATIGGQEYQLTEVKAEQTVSTEQATMGQISLTDVQNGNYVLVETRNDSDLVTPAEPVFFSLPMINRVANSSELLDDINIYPKNTVKETTFTFTKYLNQVDDANKLAGVEFTLYRGVPGEDGAAIFQLPTGENGAMENVVRTTNDQGVITFENLPSGDYYLVENSVPGRKALGDRIPAIRSITKDGKKERVLLNPSFYAKDDLNNILRFTVNAETPENAFTAAFVNYIEPDGEKNLVHDDDKTLYKENELHDFNFNGLPRFKGSIRIPYNIMGGGSQEVNGKQTTQRPYGKFIYKDKPQDKTKLQLPTGVTAENFDAMNLVVKSGDTPLKAGTDYTVALTKDGGFTVDFITTDGTWKKPDGTTENIRTVSPTVAGLVGKDINILYNMELTQKAEPDEDIYNDMTFIYNNHPTNDEKFDVEFKDRDYVETYGRKFLKTTTQMMGLAENADETVEGAQFHVLNADGSQVLSTNAEGKRVWETEGTEGVTPVVLTSDAEGKFEITGLEEGSYQLKEIAAPEGYLINTKNLTFDVGQWSYESEEGVETRDHFVNRKDTDLPFTGYTATAIVVGIGGIATAIITSKRKKKEELVIED